MANQPTQRERLRTILAVKPIVRAQELRTEAVSGPICAVPKTLADLFRNSRLIDRSVAIEELRAALDQRKARPAEIADAAKAGGAWKRRQPYQEALVPCS